MFDDTTHHARAQALAALFGEVKARHHKVELGGRELLADARAAGKALLKIKAACGHGEFLPALDRHWPGNRRTASRYILIAENWQKVHQAPDMATALSWITRATGEPDEPKAPRTPNGTACPISHDSQPPNGKAEAATAAPKVTVGQTSSNGTTPRPTPPDPAAAVALLARLLAAVGRVRVALSEAYHRDAASSRALRAAAADDPSVLVRQTAGTVRSGRADGVEFGIPLVTNAALDALTRLAERARRGLERETGSD